METICTECSWTGDFSELVSDDVVEDADGDMSANYINACPMCHGFTVDMDDLNR